MLVSRSDPIRSDACQKSQLASDMCVATVSVMASTSWLDSQNVQSVARARYVGSFDQDELPHAAAQVPGLIRLLHVAICSQNVFERVSNF